MSTEMDLDTDMAPSSEEHGAEVRCVMPPFWPRLGVELEWMSQAQAEQERVEQLVYDENLWGLLKRHPQRDDFLQEFETAEVGRGVEHLNSLAEQARAGVDQADEDAAAARADIAQLVEQLAQEDPGEVTHMLDKQRREGLKKVTQRSQTLREVDVLHSDSLAEVLIRDLGESERDRVEAMDEDATFAKIADVGRVRSQARHETARTWAEQLLGASGTSLEPLALKISTAGNCGVGKLRTQAAKAQEVMQEAQATRDGLQESLRELGSRMAACTLRKKKAAETLSQKRKALKQTLLALQAQSKEYDLAHLNNEILRLKEKCLSDCIDEMNKQVELAEPACRNVEEACEEWRSFAKDQAQAVQGEQRVEAAKAVQKTTEALSAEALNLDVGLRLLCKVHYEKKSKALRLKTASKPIADSISRLREELANPSCTAKAKKSKDFMQKKEKLACLHKKIQTLEASCQVLEATMHTGETKLQRLGQLTGQELLHLETESTSLVADAYPDLVLPPEADDEELDEEEEDQAVLPSPGDVLTAIRAKVKVALLQERVDLEFRGRAQAAAEAEVWVSAEAEAQTAAEAEAQAQAQATAEAEAQP